ncbi:hypothetical protein D9756_006456 [Leucocoprinus leucothites]|uniref:Transmembrane protein n=1 Tax=Leucocoprinus leucothites TaxID=201217 RepID=A0A8H5LHC1_9AGAR|nr:hypothetical protein D9756_006456 [Leucoagaricus leucothites]
MTIRDDMSDSLLKWISPDLTKFPRFPRFASPSVMIIFASTLTVGKVGTIINGVLAFLSVTVSSSLVLLFIFFMPKTNAALTWSALARTLHSSIWPTLLQTDSSTQPRTTRTISFLSYLTLFTTLLVPIASIILPFGLRRGPLLPGHPQMIRAKYIPDSSPLGTSTTLNYPTFQRGRVCGFFDLIPCPGKEDTNNASYSPSTIDIFNSTSHGPFNMQYRRYFSDPSQSTNMSRCLWGTSETLLLREGAFVVEGLIVDMSDDHPGIGFWNQSVPDITQGGTWSQDVLWLEPVTACANTNLTIDYVQPPGPIIDIHSYELTDRGGFYGLRHQQPPSVYQGQDIDLSQHAYTGSAWNNNLLMQALNTTRGSSFEGNTFTVLENSTLPFLPLPVAVGQVRPLLLYSNSTTGLVANNMCTGLDTFTRANITNVHVTCGGILGPPLRTDGGDERSFNEGSQWRQQIHVCASTTRASIQTVTFSTNDTSDLRNIQLTLQPNKQSVLWAVEKTDLNISDVNLLWGRVADRLEGNPSLWTLRSETLYLPAGISALPASVLPHGQPEAAFGAAWAGVYSPTFDTSGPGLTIFDYPGSSDYAIKTKLQSFAKNDPILGPSRARNAIWVDIMANNLVGIQTAPNLLASPFTPSIAYNLKFAIPGLILFLVWAYTFLTSTFLLASRKLTFKHIRLVLNHTAVGRVAVGTPFIQVTDRHSGDRPRISNDQSQVRMEETIGPDTALVDGKDLRLPGCDQPKRVDKGHDALLTLALDRNSKSRVQDD